MGRESWKAITADSKVWHLGFSHYQGVVKAKCVRRLNDLNTKFGLVKIWSGESSDLEERNSQSHQITVALKNLWNSAINSVQYQVRGQLDRYSAATIHFWERCRFSSLVPRPSAPPVFDRLQMVD